MYELKDIKDYNSDARDEWQQKVFEAVNQRGTGLCDPPAVDVFGTIICLNNKPYTRSMPMIDDILATFEKL